MPTLKTLHDALSHSDFSLGSSLSHFSFLFFLLSIGLALAFRLGMRWVSLVLLLHQLVLFLFHLSCLLLQVLILKH